MKTFRRLAKLATILAICSLVAGCDDVKVYGSVGYSSYHGYGGGGYGGHESSVRVGGRIY